MVEMTDDSDQVGVDSTRPQSPSLPPRYSRRLDDELINHLAEQQSPRYSRLFADDFIPPHLIPPTIPEDGTTTGFVGLIRGPTSPRSVPNMRRSFISQNLAPRALQPQLPPGPLSLTIDSGAIYPPPPSKALYHLPRALTWNGNEILLNLSIPASSPPNSSSGRRWKDSPRDLNLYVLRRTPFTNEIALLSKRDTGRAAVMKGKRALFGSGMSWDVEVQGKVVLQYAKGRWKDAKGKVVAAERRREGKNKKSNESTSSWLSSQKPEITIFNDRVAGLSEETTRHLIVAAWSGRMWQALHKQPRLIGAFIRGRGEFSALNPLSLRYTTTTLAR